MMMNDVRDVLLTTQQQQEHTGVRYESDRQRRVSGLIQSVHLPAAVSLRQPPTIMHDRERAFSPDVVALTLAAGTKVDHWESLTQTRTTLDILYIMSEIRITPILY